MKTILNFTMYQISRLSETMYPISPSAFDNEDQISKKIFKSTIFSTGQQYYGEQRYCLTLFSDGQHNIENKINFHFINKRCLHEYIKIF